MAKYRVLVSWSMCAEYEVEANDVVEATFQVEGKAMMQDEEGLVKLYEEYIDDSFEVDEAYLITEEEQKNV